MGRPNLWLAEACARELLRVLEVPVIVRPFNRSKPLNITFYTNMNFLVSRRRLHRYAHPAYRKLVHNFVEEGLCVPPHTPPQSELELAQGCREAPRQPPSPLLALRMHV